MELTDLLEASGALVEDVIAYGEKRSLSRRDLWLVLSMAHVMLGDVLYPYPQDAIEAYEGVQEAAATYKAVVGPVDGVC
jgi:hypothetical protein